MILWAIFKGIAFEKCRIGFRFNEMRFKVSNLYILFTFYKFTFTNLCILCNYFTWKIQVYIKIRDKVYI